MGRCGCAGRSPRRSPRGSWPRMCSRPNSCGSSARAVEFPMRPRRGLRSGAMDPCVAHVDMDAFYVSIELLRRPELRGKPVVVATGTDPTARGVVMTASYEARKFGVHSALPLATAHRRCPQMVLLPRDMQHYVEWSRRVMGIVREEITRVEVVG